MGELVNNRALRVQTLKNVIKELHNGGPAQEVTAMLKNLRCEPRCRRLIGHAFNLE